MQIGVFFALMFGRRKAVEMIANSLNGIQRINELKEELLLARGEQNRLELKLMIADVAMMTNFGESKAPVSKPSKSNRPVQNPPESITPRFSQEYYIELLNSQNEAKISNEDWEWFYKDETCSTTEAASFLNVGETTAKRWAGDKLKCFKEGRKVRIYRGSVVCSKYEIADAI